MHVSYKHTETYFLIVVVPKVSEMVYNIQFWHGVDIFFHRMQKILTIKGTHHNSRMCVATVIIASFQALVGLIIMIIAY